MQAVLLRTASDHRVVKKSTSEIKKVNVSFLEPADMKNPVFVLSYFSGIEKVNYLYVPQWSRYYFTKAPVFIDGNRVEISCNEDVLMSYAGQILATTQIITRSADEKIYNLYLNDPKFNALMNSQIQQKVFGNDVFNTGKLTPSEENYLLRVVNAPEIKKEG